MGISQRIAAPINILSRRIRIKTDTKKRAAIIDENDKITSDSKVEFGFTKDLIEKFTPMLYGSRGDARIHWHNNQPTTEIDNQRFSQKITESAKRLKSSKSQPK